MNIAINGLFLSLKNTGGGRYLTDLLNGLRLFRKDVRYFLLADKLIKINKELFPDSFIGFIDCGWMSRFRPARIFWENFILPGVIINKKIDLLHSAGFTLPLNIRCKTVVTIFDMTFFSMPQVHIRSKVAYFKTMIPLTLKKADRIIAISKQTKNDIINICKIPADKIKVIYIGCGKKFKVIKDINIIEKIKEKYNLPKKYILFVGTIEPRKNIESLVYAYSMLKNKGCGHKLVIAGKYGWQYKKIFNIIKLLALEEDIIFTDFVLDEDLPAIYNGASVFVYPSLYEGFGIPVLEAMSCGVPVITSNVSSLPEIAGEAGILINPIDIKEMSKAIEKVLRDSDLADNMVNRGLDRIKLFTTERMAEETINVYNSVLFN